MHITKNIHPSKEACLSQISIFIITVKNLQTFPTIVKLVADKCLRHAREKYDIAIPNTIDTDNVTIFIVVV